jgi:hypothetical protein
MRNHHRSILVAGALLLTASPVRADYDEYDKEAYPKELVSRPLLLAPAMLEVAVGVATDIVGQKDERIHTQADFIYGISSRMQLGATTSLAALPTDGFAVNDASVWGEYSIVPSINGRVGAFITAPRDPVADELDTSYGLRFGTPMKLRLSPSAALIAHPRISFADQTVFEGPVGAQIQVVSGLAFTLETGLRMIDFELSDETVSVPFGAGVTASFSRLFDVSAQYRFTDLAHASGRDDRWLLAMLVFRG